MDQVTGTVIAVLGISGGLCTVTCVAIVAWIVNKFIGSHAEHALIGEPKDLVLKKLELQARQLEEAAKVADLERQMHQHLTQRSGPNPYAQPDDPWHGPPPPDDLEYPEEDLANYQQPPPIRANGVPR